MTVSDWGSRVPCLSLMQPHASLVIWDEKHVETRDWGTNYRGTIAIHASKGWGKDERALVAREPFAAATRRHGKRYAEEFPVGVLLGVVELVAVKRMGATEAEVADWLRRHAGVVTEQEFAFGAYGEGRVGWFMAKPRALREPIEMRGQVGLFALAPEIAGELRRRLDEGRAVVSPGARADDARREAFEERAGILEFDAGLPRAEAERQAKEMTT